MTRRHRHTAPRLRLLFSGMIAADPYQGGATWAVLQYVLGLRALGHDVVFVEPVPRDALQPAGVPLARTRNAAYFRAVTAAFGLEGAAALVLEGTRETVGLPYARLRAAARRADALLNVSGMLADPALTEPAPVRAYLDLDPGFVQLWHATQGIDMRLDGHTHFVTVGQAVGAPECPVPTCGRRWIGTLPPVVLAHWPVAAVPPGDALTTVANWRGYGSIWHDGVHYGQKAHALRDLIALPERVPDPFSLALAIHPDEKDDLAALDAHGWRLVDPAKTAATPASYRRFIQQSRAEFGVAKSGYVRARCGWFSDRSACYLASGRPVLAQETGFSAFLPTGEGLFAFETVDDVVGHLDAIRGAYARHARAARALAEAHFDAGRVLPRLLRHIDLAA